MNRQEPDFPEPVFRTLSDPLDTDEAKLWMLRRLADSWLRMYEEAVAGRDTEDPITVDEFARRVGVSRSRAYRLLERGLVPGAFKTGPPGSKCHWFIPHNAPERFLAQGDREEA